MKTTNVVLHVTSQSLNGSFLSLFNYVISSKKREGSSAFESLIHVNMYSAELRSWEYIHYVISIPDYVFFFVESAAI